MVKGDGGRDVLAQVYVKVSAHNRVVVLQSFEKLLADGL
jgi:hypothetical protein